MNDKKKTWDKEKVYDEEIYPLMEKIITICIDNDIPLLATFHVIERQEKDDGLFCTTSLNKNSPLLTKLTRQLVSGYDQLPDKAGKYFEDKD